MFGRLASVPFDRPPYSTRWPELANILNDEPLVPKGNAIARNIHVGPQWLHEQPIAGDQPFDISWVRMENNLTDRDPKLFDPANGDFRLAPDSPAWEMGFRPIPFEKIGLQADEYRPAERRRAAFALEGRQPSEKPQGARRARR
ncbi:MAG: hypothetical protein BWZ10_02951 [candidate division BRC1 bacterium ADurb.BinA364]|nr:MAG: hypothetical protein BWZ10_02951 [candidate division BRC1 bacterium ADurb.BinA364]